MNRFSRGPIAADVQSNFVPLPIDAIARQIERKQNQYDLTKAQLDAEEQAVLGVKGMSQDRDNLTKIQNQYSDEILKGVEEVGGDYSRLGGLVDLTARKLKKDLSSGHLAAIQSNYATAMKHKEDMDKWRLAGGGDRGYNLALRSLSEFKGTKQNPDGTYTKINPYTPVKEESLSKMAQERASADVEQYTRSGDRFRKAATVRDHTYASLIADESAMSNAREEVRAKHGKLSAEEEYKKVEDYLYGVAQNAANQRSFYEYHKVTGEEQDPYTGATVSNYDIQMSTLPSKRLGAKGAKYTAVPQRLMAGTLSLLYKVSPDPLKIGESLDKVNWAGVAKEELEQTRKNIIGDTDLSKVFKSMGKDPEKMDLDELASTLNSLSELDASSRAGRISVLIGKDGNPIQRRKETASQIQHGKVTIAETGEEVTDKKALVEAIFTKDQDKEKALFSGEAQQGYLTPGSNTYYLGGVTYVIEPPVVRSPAVVDNAIEMALRTGYYKYTVGNKTVTAIPETFGDPESKVNFEINGKPAKDSDLEYLNGYK